MKSIVLTSFAHDEPSVSNFAVVDTPEPVLPNNDNHYFIVKTLYLSVDPYMRTRMRPSREGYIPSFEIGKPISGLLVGEVIKTNDPENFPAGTIISSFGDFSEYLLMSQYDPMMFKLPLDRESASHGLGVMGMPGVTAYFGFHDICQPKKGESILISGAAGAVGTYVGQLAKAHGCTVYGITGSDEKAKILVEELGFDGAINHKNTNTTEALKEAIIRMCPQGVDMYFDNVGGTITDAVLQTMKLGGRVCICGSHATHEQPDVGRRQWTSIMTRELTVKGFRVIREYETRYHEGLREMTRLFLKDKSIIAKQCFAYGIESVPKAFVSMFSGKDIGKLVIKI